jgi:K(+)-stimulated pyrophosphate-energized sodium pump
MRTWNANLASAGRRFAKRRFAKTSAVLAALLLTVGQALAQTDEAGGEAALKLPDLSSVSFLGMNGHNLLMIGLLFCVFGLSFGMAIFMRLKNLPVHRSMREISELIYETCKTYLITQGKFLMLLWAFIAAIIVLYFGVLRHFEIPRVAIILVFSLVGIAGSYGVAWFGIRVNTFANSRTAFASLPGKPYPVYQIPLEAGMSIGMMLISVELLIMLFILLFVPGDYAGPCFIGFAIGESLGAAALRIAGGIFTKIADIGADLMKIVFKIKEDDARNPGVIADCTGDNAGDSVGPSADGFETYGVTGVALITFILLGVKDPSIQVQLLVWIFVMRIMMLVASALAYFINSAIAKARFGNADKMNFETPLTWLVWLTSIVSHHPEPRWRRFAVVEVGLDHLLRNARWSGDPRVGQGLHFRGIAPRQRSGDLSQRRRRFAWNSLRICRRKLFRILVGSYDGRAHVGCLFLQRDGPDGGGYHDCRTGIRFRPGGLRIPRHGSGDDCRRFLRSGHG